MVLLLVKYQFPVLLKITCANGNVILLQMFSDYQMQEMSENFIDSFGFQDDEFTESDMSVRSVRDRIPIALLSLSNLLLQPRNEEAEQRQLVDANRRLDQAGNI